MLGLGYVQDVFTNMGPYAAGAATVIVPAYIPMPGIVIDTLMIVPPLVWQAGAGYMVATPGEDQACAAMKGIAGGIGAAFVINRLIG